MERGILSVGPKYGEVNEMFRDRLHAGFLLGRTLAEGFQHIGGVDPSKVVVIALPRGGVPVAKQIASALGCSLDVVVSKKIGAPGQPEFALGAVTSDGVAVVNDELVNYLQIPGEYLEREKRYLAEKTKSQEEYWRRAAGLSENLDVRDKLVILVDDGIATGMTVMAAARSLKARGVRQLILATPVMSSSSYEFLKKECECIVTLAIPPEFSAVGQFYADFHQVEDQETIECLRQNGAALKTA